MDSLPNGPKDATVRPESPATAADPQATTGAPTSPLQNQPERRGRGRPRGAKDKKPRKPGGGRHSHKKGNPPANATFPPDVDVRRLWHGTSVRRYQAAEDFGAACVEYLVWAQENNMPWTLSALAAFVGFNNLSKFNAQAQRGEAWANVVQNARLCVMSALEARLHGVGNPAGAIFAMYNIDPEHWQNQRHVFNTTFKLKPEELPLLPPEVIERIASGIEAQVAIAEYNNRHPELLRGIQDASAERVADGEAGSVSPEDRTPDYEVVP